MIKCANLFDQDVGHEIELADNYYNFNNKIWDTKLNWDYELNSLVYTISMFMILFSLFTQSKRF